MAFDYPQTGYRFLVVFELLVQVPPNDVAFQEVTGLTATAQFSEALREGGENRFAHKLPTGLSFGDLVLKRGKFMGSGVLHWVRNAVERFQFEPTNLMITLINADDVPLFNWYVVNAVPQEISISGINAMESQVLVESLTLSYQYFKYYDPASIAMDAASAIGGSVGLSF